MSAQLEKLNIALMDQINRGGETFLSHTKLKGRFVIRVAISNLRMEDSDLALVWQVVKREAALLTEPTR